MTVVRVDTVNLAEVSVWLAGAAVIVAIDAALLGVNPVVVVLILAALAAFGARGAPLLIGDGADWTPPAKLPGDAAVASTAATFARAVSPRVVLAVVVFTPAAVGIDLLTGREGFGAGLLAGTLVMQLASQAVAARRAAVWQRERRVVLYTDAARAPAAERRYYSRPA